MIVSNNKLLDDVHAKLDNTSELMETAVKDIVLKHINLKMVDYDKVKQNFEKFFNEDEL